MAEKQGQVSSELQVLGRRLKEFREVHPPRTRLRITQQEMAELVGTFQPIVSDYERGELRRCTASLS
jgi:transcriptional regulator with XRE-family HTH domain